MIIHGEMRFSKGVKTTKNTWVIVVNKNFTENFYLCRIQIEVRGSIRLNISGVVKITLESKNNYFSLYYNFQYRQIKYQSHSYF